MSIVELGARKVRWQGFALALVAGLLTTASVPPFGWWPLAVIGLGLLPPALEDAQRALHRFAISFTFAAALYVPSLWWLTQFSLPGGLVIALIEVVITALVLSLIGPGANGPRANGPRANSPRTNSPRANGPRTNSPRRLASVVCCAVALVAADSLRSLWPFGGLPLGGIDLGQADGPFAALVTFGGRLLLIGIVSLLGGAAVLLIRTRTYGLPVLAIAVCLLVTVGAHVLPDGTHSVRLLRVAVAQGSGPLGVKAVDDQVDRAFNATIAATKLIRKPVDLIVWPENIVDAATFSNSKKQAAIGVLAEAFGAPIVAGVVEDDPDNRKQFRNFSIVVGPGGDIGDGVSTRYDKVRRVPFGEVVYFRSLLAKFSSSLQERDARAGTKPGMIETPYGPMAIIISYEGFFDDRARSGVRAGGQALLLPTNASSFTSSHLPTQQVAAARLRARETGRWVVQAAPTGISAVLKPNGSIVTRSAIQQRVALQATITLRRGLTPYARWNDAPALILFGVLGLAAAWFSRRQRSVAGGLRGVKT